MSVDAASPKIGDNSGDGDSSERDGIRRVRVRCEYVAESTDARVLHRSVKAVLTSINLRDTLPLVQKVAVSWAASVTTTRGTLRADHLVHLTIVHAHCKYRKDDLRPHIYRIGGATRNPRQQRLAFACFSLFLRLFTNS